MAQKIRQVVKQEKKKKTIESPATHPKEQIHQQQG